MVFIGCQCGHFFKVPATQAGKAGDCPACHRSIRLIATHLDPEANEPAVCLVCTAGPHHVGRQFFLAGDGPIVVGKSRERDLPLRDPMVSRVHCRFVRAEGSWRIEDQGSTNGIEVNGRKVPAGDLRHGDEVVIGDCVFTYLTPLTPAPILTPTPAPEEPPAPAETAAPVRVVKVKPAPKVIPVRKTAKTAEVDGPLAVFDETGLLALAKDEYVEPAAKVSQIAPAKSVPGAGSRLPPTPPAGPACPSCRQRLPLGAVICVNCGINLKTGKSILTSLETGLDETYARAEAITRWISWIIWWGFSPVASEAFGTRKPYAIRGIVLVTVLVSVCFLVLVYSDSPAFDSWQNLMLWSGKFDPSRIPTEFLPRGIRPDRVKPADMGLGTYHPYQLITHAFLHGGLLHLAGNMIFLLVFGSRVNALIGSILTMAIYPVLAVFAALFQMAAGTNDIYRPMLGASGAVMGLAGMYFVFFPLHRMHILAWYRLGLLFRFELHLTIFAVRGFWVVLFYIGMDVLFTALGAEDNVARWAHLGGFIIGMAAALGLMMIRLVNARGSDLLTLVFGRHAWGIVGRPNRGEAIAAATE
ncbi:MAG TPA: rhomboid family intramembrane serine protease [Phycisphaerae bacterium]|nr:rhomboid family intramembrane serine protease [Phycisphaerae bacterium]